MSDTSPRKIAHKIKRGTTISELGVNPQVTASSTVVESASLSLPATSQSLRQQAETLYQETYINASSKSDVMSRLESGQMWQELGVHQIELEMQNDELRAIQLELDRQKSRYFDLYDLAPVGYCSLNKFGLFIETNFSVAAMLGASRGALIKCPLSQYILKEDQHAYYSLLNQLKKSRESRSCELKVASAVGKIFQVQVSATSLLDDDGELTYRLVLTEISGRKQLELDLLKANAELAVLRNERSHAAEPRLADHAMSDFRLRTLIHAIPDLVWLKDTQGVYLSCNSRFEQFFGAPERLIVGKTDYDFVDKELADLFRKNDQVAMDRDGPSSNEEWVTFASDGHRELLDTTKTPVRDSKGQVIGVLGIAHDITERHRIALALIESESHFRTVFEMSLDAILLHRNGKLLFVNPAAVQMFGAKNAQELLDKSVLTLIHPDFHHLVVERVKAVTEHGIAGLRIEEKYIKFDGTVFDVEAQSQPISHLGQTAVLSTLRDITERKRSEAKLKLAASVFNNAREGIAITDASGIIIDVNDAFVRITGYDRAEALGQNPRILRSGHQDANFYTAMWNDLLANGFWSGEIFNRRKDGVVYPEQLTIQSVRDEQGGNESYLAMFTDITERKVLESKMQQMAFCDALTGLPNRRMLSDRLSQVMAASKRSGLYCALMFLDMDNFKSLNDTHGHEMGDLLLIEVARRLTECLREVDTVARFGGDEFVVLLDELGRDKQLSTEQAAGVAEKIRASLAAPYHLTAAHTGRQVTTIEHHCSTSIGAVVFVNHETSQTDLMKSADAAMYEAKDAGRNVVRFAPATGTLLKRPAGMFDLSDSGQRNIRQLAFASEDMNFQHAERAKRAAELVIANKELQFQNKEKDIRAQKEASHDHFLTTHLLHEHESLQDPGLMPTSESNAALVMDINGCIVECTLAAADLLGRMAESLVGQDVSVVLPGLPFSQETPGYNLAYVSMNHAMDTWKKSTALTPSGGSIAVEIVLYIFKRGSKYFLALCLRRPTFSATLVKLLG